MQLNWNEIRQVSSDQADLKSPPPVSDDGGGGGGLAGALADALKKREQVIQTGMIIGVIEALGPKILLTTGILFMLLFGPAFSKLMSFLFYSPTSLRVCDVALSIVISLVNFLLSKLTSVTVAS